MRIIDYFESTVGHLLATKLYKDEKSKLVFNRVY